MNYRLFFQRPTSWAKSLRVYNDTVTPDHLPKDMGFFFELYQDCFQHHVQPRLQAKGDSLSVITDEARKRIVQQDELTAYFIKNIYVPEGLCFTANDSELDRRKHARTFDEFVHEISGNPVDTDFPERVNRPGTNRINILIGDVGVGKSLLATKIICEVEAMNEAMPTAQYRLLPVYIDLEVFLKTGKGSFRDVDNTFIGMVYGNIRALLEKDGRWRAQYGADLPDDPVQRFIKLNLALLRDKTRLFIILDNTDRYHFYYSPYAFFDKYRRTQAEKVHQNFTELFNIFSRTEFLGDQGLAILFACRRSVLKFWMGARPEDNHRTLNKDYGVYQIEKVSELAAIESRMKLVQAAVERIEKVKPGQAGPYGQHIARIETAFRESLTSKSRNSLHTITCLTHHGTRSFLDFLAALKIDFRTQYELVDRLFVDQPHNLLRLYITNLKKRYAQAEEHFPNLYLCDAVATRNPEFDDAHVPHRHTYWLKYLLLKLIVDRDAAGEIATYHELKELFVDGCGYEPSLFDLMLGELNAVNSFRCIEIDDDASGLRDPLRLRATSRGRTLLSKQPQAGVELCFDFDYVQFVIDDPLLAVPAPWRNKVYVETDIGYVMAASASYAGELRQYLRAKCPAVVWFLHTLQASVEYELISGVARCKVVASLFPEFPAIWRSLFESYRLILERAKMEDTLVEVQDLHQKLAADARFKDFFDNFRTEYPSGVVGPV